MAGDDTQEPPQAKRLKLAVEPHHERAVAWIYDNGRNQFEVEKTPAEKLFDRVRQLDFIVPGDEVEQSAAAQQEKNEEKPGDADAPAAPRVWPWAEVAVNLNLAKSEAGFAADLLWLLQQNKYMTVDAAYVKNPPYNRSRRPHDAVLRERTKHQQLRAASVALKSAAGRLGAAVQQDMDYYVELRDMQKRWRLRQVPRGITVDLSYGTTGSGFADGTEFSVVREKDTSSARSLGVRLPAEYDTFKLLLTTFASDGVFAPCIVPNRYLRPPCDPHFDRLAMAQHAIFGKELMSILSKQVAETPSLPVQTEGRVMKFELDDHISMYLTLGSQPTPTETPIGNVDQLQPSLIYNSVMGLMLQQFLRQQHRAVHRTRHLPGIPTQSAESGLQTTNRERGNTGGETLLVRAFAVAQHIAFRRRIRTLVDMVNLSFTEPQISVHWQPSALATVSHVTLALTVRDFRPHSDDVYRDVLSLTLRGCEIQAVMMDGRSQALAEHEVLLFLLMRIARAQLAALRTEAVALGWDVLHESSAAVDARLVLRIQHHSHVVTVDLQPTLAPLAVVIALSVSGDPVVSWHSLPGSRLREKLQALLSYLDHR